MCVRARAGGHGKGIRLDLDVMRSSSLTQLAMALAATKVSPALKRRRGRIRSKSRLTCGGLVMVNE